MKRSIFILINIFWMASQGVAAQSSDQNYIQTTTYLNETGSTSLRTVQYFDGLGRPVETVQVGAGGNGEDLVVYQEYDAFGRESNTWLPRPKAGNNGAFVTLSNFQNLSSSIYQNDAKPYSKRVYEPSPLNRAVEEYGPGANWHDYDRSVKTEYQTGSCAYYYVSGNNLVKNGNYANGQLFVTKTSDENGRNTTYTYTDKLGRVVLIQRDSEIGNTYYVYDDFGNLRFVLPPLAADALTANTSWNTDN
ncbi:MAG: DUF6443 domain-containing protein, partial [Tannerella sp.]|nr:DUF6443 domain-containing protein [Tannerella sp.]